MNDPQVTFFVAGSPVAQGSARAFVVGGKARITSTATGLTQWRSAIVYAAQQAWGKELVTGPVEVVLQFCLPRPKSLRKGASVHTKAPDVDKLLRAVLDGLSGVVFADDRQVFRAECSKWYADIGSQPGVLITVIDRSEWERKGQGVRE